MEEMKMKSIYADTSLGLVNEINHRGITKEQIVSIITIGNQFALFYYE